MDVGGGKPSGRFLGLKREKKEVTGLSHWDAGVRFKV